MRIIARSTLIDYYSQNPQAKSALESWYQKTLKAEWKILQTLEKLLPQFRKLVLNITFLISKETITVWWW